MIKRASWRPVHGQVVIGGIAADNMSQPQGCDHDVGLQSELSSLECVLNSLNNQDYLNGGCLGFTHAVLHTILY